MPSTARPKVVGAFVHGYPRPKVVLRTRGAMPPRKRAAHSKKLAGAKVAKVAKEENQVTAVRSLLSVFCSAISSFT